MLVAGLLLRSPRLAINALLGFGVTLLPAVLARDYRILLDTRLALLVTVAVFLHSLGMLAVSLGSEPLLVQYGLGDTMLDLVFDAVGALFVVLFRRQRLERVVSTLREGLEEPD